MGINVNNLQDKVACPAEVEELLVKAAGIALARAGRGHAGVDITLADDEYLRELNLRYRGIDAPTDVLSFSLQEENGEEPRYEDQGPDLLGDVIVSAERAAAQAAAYGHSFQRELSYLVVHGVLHLLGHDHGQPDLRRLMRAEEEKILSEQAHV